MQIMVCYDGSDRAQEALERTLSYFKSQKPEIILLTVVEPPLDATSVEDESFEKWRSKRDDDLKEAASWVAGQGFEVDAMLAIGDPRRMIIEASERKKPALIVVGRRGGTALEKIILGSVAAYLVRHARFPVAVI